jgi:hypothetical protein
MQVLVAYALFILLMAAPFIVAAVLASGWHCQTKCTGW